MRTLKAQDLRPGMEVWIGPAWSSHGMKPGYWFRIEEVEIYRGAWDEGTLVEIGATALAPDYEVTVR